MSYFHKLDARQQEEAEALFTEWYASLQDNGIDPVVANSACLSIALAIARAIGKMGSGQQNFPVHFAGMVYGWLLSLTPEERQQFWDRMDEIEDELAAPDEIAN